jgi:hypothetical protein
MLCVVAMTAMFGSVNVMSVVTSLFGYKVAVCWHNSILLFDGFRLNCFCTNSGQEEENEENRKSVMVVFHSSMNDANTRDRVQRQLVAGCYEYVTSETSFSLSFIPGTKSKSRCWELPFHACNQC